MGGCLTTADKNLKPPDESKAMHDDKTQRRGRGTLLTCALGFRCPRLARGRVSPKPPSDRDRAIVRLETAVAELEKSKFVFPLSQKEIYLLYGSWELVKKDFILTGMRMFARMFEVSPEVKNSFEKFRSLGEDQTEAMQSKVLETHGMVVMFAVDEIINCIDDPDSAIELLIEQGKSHARFGDLGEDIFWAIEQPFIYAVNQVLGFKFTDQLKEIYTKAIHFILTVIVSGFRQANVSKARNSVSETLFASVSGSLPMAVTALTGRPPRHNQIQDDTDSVELICID